jgi:hypothetical protein
LLGGKVASTPLADVVYLSRPVEAGLRELAPALAQ